MKRSTTFPFRVTFTSAIVLMSLLLTTACSDKGVNKNPSSLAREAIDQAQAKYAESKQSGYAWFQTSVVLEAATEAFEADNFSQAISEADRASSLAGASLAQAKAEQSAWLERFPKASSKKPSSLSE